MEGSYVLPFLAKSELLFAYGYEIYNQRISYIIEIMRLDMVMKMSKNVLKELNNGFLSIMLFIFGIVQIGLVINLFAMFYYWCVYSSVKPFVTLILLGVIFGIVYNSGLASGGIAGYMWGFMFVLYVFLYAVFIAGKIVSRSRFNTKQKKEIKRETYNKLFTFHHAIRSMNVWALFAWAPFTFMCILPPTAIVSVIWYLSLLYGILGGSALGAGSMVNLISTHSYLRSTMEETNELVDSWIII